MVANSRAFFIPKRFFDLVKYAKAAVLKSPCRSKTASKLLLRSLCKNATRAAKALGQHHAFPICFLSKVIISLIYGWFSIRGANSDFMSQLIFALGWLVLRAASAGRAITMSPSALGFIIKMFLKLSAISG